MNTESFESIVNAAMEKVHGNYEIEAIEVAGMLGRLSGVHDREIRDTAQQQYDRGFNDGEHSMDAEHRAIAMRLRGLRFNGGSHENLARIAYAIYPCATGWTCESAAGLRDRLIDLMGGVSDDTCGAGCCCSAADCDGDCGLQRKEVTDERFADDCGADTRCGGCGGDLHLDGLVTYDVLGNERRKAIAELRKMRSCKEDYFAPELFFDGLYDALGCRAETGGDSGDQMCDRLIHLLGGNQQSGIDVLREMDEREAEGRITDELRKWASDRHCKGISHTDVLNIGLIADRIDAQFDRICQQQEAVLQSTIDGMINERKRTFEAIDARAVKLAEQRNEARRVLIDRNAEYFKLLDEYGDMLDEYAEMEGERDNLLDLLRDARKEYMRLRTENQIMLGDMRRRQAKLDESEHERRDDGR